MPEYCIYTLSAGNTIAEVPKELECASDEEAIKEANAVLDVLDVEVWQGARIVIRLKSTDRQVMGAYGARSRIPPPRTIEENNNACFTVRDKGRHASAISISRMNLGVDQRRTS
jgi:hypothetical protein